MSIGILWTSLEQLSETLPLKIEEKRWGIAQW